MPTAQYPGDNEEEGEGTPTSSSSPSSNDGTSNNSAQRTKKRSKRKVSTINNDDDDSDEEDYFSTSSSAVVATVTKSHEDAADDNSQNDNDEQLIVGMSKVPLLNMKDNSSGDDVNYNDSLSDGNVDNCEGAGRCWSCFIHLNNNDTANKNDGQRTSSASFFTTHEHPLLSIPVCSICNDRADAVEGKVIDAQLQSVNDGTNHDIMVNFGGGSSGGDDNNITAAAMMNNDGQPEEIEANACSWCGLMVESDSSSHSTSSSIHSPSNRLTIVGGVEQTQSSSVYLDDIQLGDEGSNELLLCDTCPRGMCVKCCAVGLGGHVDALKAVRQVCDGCCVREIKWFRKKANNATKHMLHTNVFLWLARP